MLIRLQHYDEALRVYGESALLAEQSGDAGAYAAVLGNRVRALAGSGGEVLAALDLALAANRALPDGYDKGFNFLSLGYLAADAGHTARAFDAYRAARALGERLKKPRLHSYALGYLADLYATAGRLLAKQRRLNEAVDAYRRAVATVQPIRSALAGGLRPTPPEFRRGVGRLYYELLRDHRSICLLRATIETVPFDVDVKKGYAGDLLLLAAQQHPSYKGRMDQFRCR